jgi:RNA polymerase sigma-70 factor, ECF subfamily
MTNQVFRLGRAAEVRTRANPIHGFGLRTPGKGIDRQPATFPSESRDTNDLLTESARFRIPVVARARTTMAAAESNGPLNTRGVIATKRGEEFRLLVRLKNSDSEAFHEVVSRYNHALLRRARIITSDHTLAEDAVQEAWLAVFRGIRKFEARSSLKTWLFSILDNRAKTLIGKERRNRQSLAMGAVLPDVTLADSRETILSEEEALRHVRAAIDSLPAMQRKVVVLRVLDDRSPHSITLELGITEGNQRVLLHRARRALNGALRNGALVRTSPHGPADQDAYLNRSSSDASPRTASRLTTHRATPLEHPARVLGFANSARESNSGLRNRMRWPERSTPQPNHKRSFSSRFVARKSL